MPLDVVILLEVLSVVWRFDLRSSASNSGRRGVAERLEEPFAPFSVEFFILVKIPASPVPAPAPAAPARAAAWPYSTKACPDETPGSTRPTTKQRTADPAILMARSPEFALDVTRKRARRQLAKGPMTPNGDGAVVRIPGRPPARGRQRAVNTSRGKPGAEMHSSAAAISVPPIMVPVRAGTRSVQAAGSGRPAGLGRVAWWPPRQVGSGLVSS